MDNENLQIKVLMKKDFLDKINWFRLNYDKEIGGFISGEIKDGVIVLEKLLIPEQEVGSASVKMKGKDLVKLRQEYGDECKRIIGEWHSHNTMMASWSGIDEDDFIKPFTENRDLSIFVVSGCNGHLVRLEVRKPFFMSIDKIPFIVEENAKVKRWCEREIKKKLAETDYISSNTTNPWDDDFKEINNFDGGVSFLDEDEEIEEKEDYKNSTFEKELKKEIKEKMKFNGVDVLEIVKLSWFCAEGLKQELKYLKPKVIQDKNDEWILKIEFRSKKKALKHLKMIKQKVRAVIEEEAEIGVY